MAQDDFSLGKAYCRLTQCHTVALEKSEIDRIRFVVSACFQSNTTYK